MLTYVLFALGFVLLVKGADFLVDGATDLARRLRISNLIIGLTVVAFGTSAPELFVNIFAVSGGASEIAIGNILGSNIFNVLLILGVASIIRTLTVKAETVSKEIPLSLLAAVVAGILASDRFFDGAALNQLSRTDGIILLVFFCFFIYYIYESIKRQRRQNTDSIEVTVKRHRGWVTLLLIILGLAALNLGSKWVIDGAVKIAETFGLSQSLIGLTIVAMGTSLPELATSVMAAFKRNADIAVGNVVGSNIFNIFFILGLSSAIRPLPLENVSAVDLGVVAGASLLLLAAMFTGRGKYLLERWEGVTFVALFAGYMSYLIIRG